MYSLDEKDAMLVIGLANQAIDVNINSSVHKYGVSCHFGDIAMTSR